MRYRSVLSLAIFAAACSGVDTPVGVETPNSRPSFDVEEGVKPPPPIGSGDVEISIFSPSSETPSEVTVSEGGPSASAFANLPFSAQLHGRYFANSQYTNGWIQFVSDECVTASPDAKLQYNELTGKTTGHGTLVDCEGGVTLDLSKIEITSGGFGDCTFDVTHTCRNFQFSYNGIPGGSVFVGPPSID